MLIQRNKRVLILIVAAGFCLSSSTWAQAPDPSPKKTLKQSTKPGAAKAPKAERVEQQPPAAPPTPLPLPTAEQMPSQPPTVTYQNGQLAISAQNSTLADILHAVHDRTGANIEIPPGANERVISSFGPGPARDVLTTLLNGSHFNYVMVGTEADPTAVAHVILTPKTGGETPPTVQASQAGAPMQRPLSSQQFPRPFPQAQVQDQPPDEEPPASDGMQDEEENSQDVNVDNGVDQGAPEQIQGNEEQGQNPNQPVVKTPEQLLQELQRQQQMIQQQQQQGQPGQQQSQQPQVVVPTPPPQQQTPQEKPQ